MLNILSLIFGLIALLLAIPSFIPLFGWGNWFVLPIAFVGLLFGILSRRTSGRNICIVVIIIAAIRLMLGGGIF